MQNKPVLAFKLLLIVFIGMTIYPYAKVLIETGMGTGDEYPFISPADIFWERDHTAREEGQPKPKWPAFILMKLKHPFEHSSNLAIYLLATFLLIGTWRYFASMRKRKTMLLFVLHCYCWLTIANTVYLLTRYFLLDTINNLLPKHDFPWLFLSINLMKLALILVLIRLMKLINNDSVISLQAQEVHASKWMRGAGITFEHLFILLPGLLFLFNWMALYPHINVISKGHSPAISIFRESLQNWLLVSIELILFLSYLVSESLFKTSPYKILAGTRVTNNNISQPATSRQTFLRTICRFIPLDLLSFLSRKGWHDRFSNTSVIYVNSEPWLTRHCRIGKWVGTIFIVFYSL